MMMQHTTTMSSSAAVTNKAKRGVVGLQGPRPLPLSLPGTTPSASSPPRPAKRPRVVVSGDDDVVRAPPGPVILYEHTPKVIHARPDEFKALVQRLTGRQPMTETETETEGAGDQEAEPLRHAQRAAPPTSSQQDPLVLTLGQQQVPPPLLPPSPGGAGGFLLSPGSFLFSPATMQAIHELIS